MFHDLLLEKFDPRIPLINLPCHLLNVAPGLIFIPLQILDLIVRLSQLLLDLVDDLVPLALALMRFLDLALFCQDIGRNTGMNLAQESVQGAVTWVHF